eukprot:scaffold6492_cov20-Tisochrysis_lutea.AAC.1
MLCTVFKWLAPPPWAPPRRATSVPSSTLQPSSVKGERSSSVKGSDTGSSAACKQHHLPWVG